MHRFSAEWQTKHDGAIAQLVEQRTENPCVTGSIPVGTTKTRVTKSVTLVCCMPVVFSYTILQFFHSLVSQSGIRPLSEGGVLLFLWSIYKSNLVEIDKSAILNLVESKNI